MKSSTADRSQRVALLLVFATVCIDLLGFGLVLPLLPIYGRELTAGYPSGQAGWVLGLLMSCYSLMQFVFAPLWGRVSDRVGRRPVLLVSLAGSTLFYALFGLATRWGSLGWMFAARIGAGMAGATIPTAQAYIADVTPPERRARGMALIGAAFGLGFTLGPLLGAFALTLAGDSGDRGLSPWPGYAASALSGAALLFALAKLPESYDPRRAPKARRHFDLGSFREALGVPSIGLLLATAFFAVFSLANFEGTISLAIRAKLDGGTTWVGADGEAGASEESFPQAAEETASPAAGGTDWEASRNLFLVFAYIGVIQCLVQGLVVRRLALYVSEAWLAGAGAALSTVGFVLLAIDCQRGSAGIGFLMLATAVEIGGIALVFPAIQSLISRRSDPAEQGGILGAGESISAIGRITGVVFGVRLFAQAASTPFWAAAGLMATALLLVLAAARSGKDWET